jgi:hypothetical protein
VILDCDENALRNCTRVAPNLVTPSPNDSPTETSELTMNDRVATPVGFDFLSPKRTYAISPLGKAESVPEVTVDKYSYPIFM